MRSSSPSAYGSRQIEQVGKFSSSSACAGGDVPETETDDLLPTEDAENTFVGIWRKDRRMLCDGNVLTSLDTWSCENSGFVGIVSR